ncbi:MAG: DUF3857 domain-containing protein [Bacteroidota bacterium]
MIYKLISSLILLACISPLPANGEVSKIAPQVVSKEVLPKLKKLDDVVNGLTYTGVEGDAGVTLLTERYTWVSEAGKRFNTYHYIYQAKTEQGIKSLAKSQFVYDELLTKIHLVKAQTIAPDGEKKELADNAVFLQKADEDDSSDIYSSDKKLTLVHPDIKVGSITEVIIVYEDIQPVIPSEYTGFFSLYNSWPINQQIVTVDLPKSFSDRLKIDHIGAVFQDHEKTVVTEGRVSYVWNRSKVSSRNYESGRAPTIQSGPGVIFSTIKDWNVFAKWFRELAAPQAILSNELKKEVDTWTDGLASRDEILKVLFDRVANDVRYTGLEFGMSGWQPYNCNDVWRNQYGDCKDKSNLLCAMLRYKGIEAFITLINTKHAGKINKKCPSQSAFNHAIVAYKIDSNNEAWSFADPTLTKGWVTLLAPSSSDRQALIVTDSEGLWVKTPPGGAGELNYNFDLQLDTQGVISGWLTMSINGYYTLNAVDSYVGQDRYTVIRRLESFIDRYYTGAEVVDYVVPAEYKGGVPDDSLVVKAFFTCPSKQLDQKGRWSKAFPSVSSLFYDYGSNEDRTSDFFQWTDHVKVHSTLRLPQGHIVESLPLPFEAKTPYLSIGANWKYDKVLHACISHLNADVTKSIIPAKQIGVIRQAIKALNSWLETSLLISPSDEAQPNLTSPSGRLDMELMPSGEGQLALVNRLYPLDGSIKNREQALKQVIQLFPDHPNTVFTANSSLAYLFYYRDDLKEADDLYSKLSTQSPHGIDVDEIYFSQYMHAVVLYDLKMGEEAIEMLTKLLDHNDLSDYREGWSLTMLGEYYTKLKGDYAEAQSCFEKAIKIDSDHVSKSTMNLFECYTKLGLQTEADKLIALYFSKASLDLATEITKLSNKVRSIESTENLRFAIASIERAALSLDEHKQVKEALTNLHGELHQFTVQQQVNRLISVELQALLNDNLDIYLSPKGVPQEIDTRAKVENYLEENYDEDHQAWLNMAAHYFLKYEPDDNFTYYYWRFLNYVQWYEYNKDTPYGENLYTDLAKLSEKISHRDDNYWECQFVIVTHLENHKMWDAVIKNFSKMLEDVDFNDEYEIGARQRKAHALEHEGKWLEAIESYEILQPRSTNFDSICSTTLRLGIIYLRQGSPDKALKAWQTLIDVPQSIWSEHENAAYIQAAITLAQNPEDSKKFWKETQSWWNENLKPECQKVGIDDFSNIPILLSNNSEMIESALTEAVLAKDMKSFLRATLPVLDQCRWFPDDVINFYTKVYSSVQQVSATQTRPIWQLMVDFLSLPCSPNIRSSPNTEFAQRIQVAVLYDLEDFSSAEKRAKEIISGLKDFETEHYERLLLLSIMIAQHSQNDIASIIKKAVEYWDKEKGIQYTDINQYAYFLSILLNEKDSHDECKRILQEAAATKKTDSPYSNVILDMLKALNQSAFSINDFDSSISSWLAVNKPVWYDYVAPHDAKDRRLQKSRVRKILEGRQNRELHQLEKYKILMLVIQSSEFEIDLREEAYMMLIKEMSDHLLTWQSYSEFMQKSIYRDKMPDRVNLPIHWHAFTNICDSGRKDLMHKWSRHIVAVDHDKNEKLEKFYKMGAALALNDNAQLVEIINERSQNIVTEDDKFIIGVLITTLERNGQTDTVDSIFEDVKSWELENNTLKNKLKYLFKLKQKSTAIRPEIELCEKLKALVLTKLAPLADDAPADWLDHRIITGNYLSSTQESRCIKAAMIVNDKNSITSFLDFWYNDCEFWLLNEHEIDMPLAIKVAEAVLGAQISSSRKAAFISMMLSHIKYDLAALEIFNKAIKEWLAANQSIHQIEYFVIMAEVFLREDNDNTVYMSDLLSEKQAEDSNIQRIIRLICVRQHLNNENTEELTSIIDDMEIEKLMDFSDLRLILRALRLLNRHDELDILKEFAKEDVKNSILDCWLSPDISKLWHVCELSRLLEDETLITEQWLDHVQNNLHDDEKKCAQMLVAFTNKQWDDVVKISELVLEPSIKYNAQYYKALALIKLNKQQEAHDLLQGLSQLNPLVYELPHMARYQLSKLNK